MSNENESSFEDGIKVFFAGLADKLRALATWHEADQHAMYLDDGNPMHVWSVINFHLSAGKELPEWVKEYLVRASNNLLEVAEQEPEQRPGGTALNIAKAFEMHREKRGCVFNEWRRTKAIMIVAQRVMDEMKTTNKEKYAVENVAKHASISTTVAGDAFRKAKNWGRLYKKYLKNKSKSG